MEMYIQRCAVKFAKWGNSIAIRIPAEVVTKLGISPNDEALIKMTGDYSFEITRDRKREEALKRMRELRFVLPDNYVFDRDEIYDN
jgi:antitoxin MazE